MQSEHVTQLQPPPPADPATVIKAGVGTWRAFAIDLPLRIAAETIRFAGHRFQAQAEHLAALAACGTLKDAVELQAAFLTKGVADYQTETATLSHEVTEAALARAA